MQILFILILLETTSMLRKLNKHRTEDEQTNLIFSTNFVQFKVQFQFQFKFKFQFQSNRSTCEFFLK